MRAKSFLIGAILAASIVQVASAKPAVAPADEYFGRMKLSILGISNTIHDTKLREAYDPANAAANFAKLSLAEEALEDWASKYPHDNWVPGKAYYMSHEFWAMSTPDGDRVAERCRALLRSRFAKSPYAAKSRTETAAMFELKVPAALASATAPAATAATAATTVTAAAPVTAATTEAAKTTATAAAKTTTAAAGAAAGTTASKPIPQATPHS